MRADAKRKYKVDIKPTSNQTADIKGDKKNVLAFLQDPEMYGMDDGDIESVFPELFEAAKPKKEMDMAVKPAEPKKNGNGKKDDDDDDEDDDDYDEDETDVAAKEESEKQKKYQAFFNKALKKYGVKSPAELDDTKKKEFFNYVDKNYEADKESD